MIGRLLGSLSYHARKEEADWRASNSLRKRVQYGRVRRLLVRASERPLRYSALLFLLFSLLSLIVHIRPIPGLPLIRLEIDDSTALTYLSTIWTIQATIVALIYPIVIAFVTLLIQRLHQGQSVLHIYLHDAAAVLSGSSALMLLILLGVQYLLSPLTNAVVVLNWAFLSGYWFILNVGLASFFLYRTLDFLRPANRIETVNKYVLNVAWPAEVQRHLRVHIFDNAVHLGHMPGPAYPPEEVVPKIRTGSLEWILR